MSSVIGDMALAQLEEGVSSEQTAGPSAVASMVSRATANPLATLASSAAVALPLIKILTGRKFSTTMIVASSVVIVTLIAAAIFLYFGAELPSTVRFVAVGSAAAGVVGYAVLCIYVKKVKELGPLKMIAREIAAEADNIEKVNEELQTTESRLQSLTETIGAEEKKLTTLREEFQNTQNQLDQSARQLQTTESHLEEIGKDLDKTRSEIQLSSSELVTLRKTKTDLDQQVSSLRDKISSLQSICTSFNGTIDALKKEFGDTNTKHSNLIDQEQIAINRLVELTRAMAILQELEKNNSLRNVIHEAKIKINQEWEASQGRRGQERN